MKKFGFLLLAMLIGAGAARGAVSRFSDAMALLEHGAVREAYTGLESIQLGDSDFTDALVELQKLHYRKQNWGKFFAYAQFYRAKFVGGQLGQSPLRARMLSLEAMALAKHCRWSTAEEILNWGLAQKNRMGRDEALELSLARDYLRLHHDFPRSALASEDKVKLPGAFSRQQAAWKLESKMLASIAHPKNLSVKLESECRE